MQDIAVPATVRGTANTASQEPVAFREQKSGQVIAATTTAMDGEFNIHLPEGHYDVRQGLAHTSITVLPGGLYHLDLRREHLFDFKVTLQNPGHNEIVLRVSAEGAGNHTFTIRSDNLILHEPGTQRVDLISGNAREAVWHAQVVSSETPWVAVVIPDGDINERREVTGVELPPK
jgi:hypothetical protein